MLACELHTKNAHKMSELPKADTLAGFCLLKSRRFLRDLDGCEFTDLYKSVMCEAEHGLLLAVMEHTKGNQSCAAKLLGITRTTLRQKLRNHQMLEG